MKQELKTVYVPINGETDLAVCYFSRFEEWTHEESVIKQQLITFTQEEYNKHIKSVIKDTLQTAAEKADLKERKKTLWWSSCGEYTYVKIVDKKSITNTLEQTLEKWKI